MPVSPREINGEIFKIGKQSPKALVPPHVRALTSPMEAEHNMNFYNLRQQRKPSL